MTQTTAYRAILLARQHAWDKGVSMASSAQLCLTDAVNLYDAGRYEYAHKRALKSLAYSVGIGHPHYIEVANAKG